jgi:hypothetical protein
MKFRMSRNLAIWVEVACEHRKTRSPDKSKQALIAEILHEWEEAGEAMRYLRTDGKIGWKPTQRTLDRLADAEREVEDDLEHDLL